MDELDISLKKAGSAGYVLYASSADANMRYLTGFKTGDPLFYIKRMGERGRLIVPQMEFDRAVAESGCDVMTRADARYFEILDEEVDRLRASARMVAELAGGDILVPANFPVGLARAIEQFCGVHIDPKTVETMREVKSARELDLIRAAQSVNEGALDLAISLIKKAGVHEDGTLHLDGTPLTSEYVRREMHCYFLQNGCRGVDTIVSCGEETAMPHNLGSGTLMEDTPILIDIFPQDEASGYYADMTRTVVRGEPTAEIEEIYNIVKEAKALGENMIKPGVLGSDVHGAVADFFTDAGYKTTTEGFIHSLGHGVGLEVHEGPSLSPVGKELAAGNVVTVEPGLYYRGIGGVRLEDMGVVTKEGFECFTRYKEEIRL